MGGLGGTSSLSGISGSHNIAGLVYSAACAFSTELAVWIVLVNTAAR